MSIAYVFPPTHSGCLGDNWKTIGGIRGVRVPGSYRRDARLRSIRPAHAKGMPYLSYVRLTRARPQFREIRNVRLDSGPKILSPLLGIANRGGKQD